MTRVGHGADAGQALAELLMTAGLIATLVAIAVVTLAPPVVRLIVMVVNHLAVFLSSVS